MEKQKKPIQKWQVTLQWVCVAIWALLIVIDLLWSDDRTLTLLHCAAALCFLIAAILMTKQYRKEQREEMP